MSVSLSAEAALFGTFDVPNYGDLLFPHVVAHLLGETVSELRCYSPRGRNPDWEDTYAARPVRQFALDSPPALCLIGGGNIIHARPTPLPDYADVFDNPRFTYGSLWLGASMLAASVGARLAWNAPGVPAPIEGAWARRLRDLTLAATEYVSVRDEASRTYLGASFGRPVVLPDTALKLRSIWPAASLQVHARKAFESRGMATPDRWIAIHLNERYIDSDLPRACASINRIAAGLEAVPALIAIAPCHDDDNLARRASRLLNGPVLVADRVHGLKEIAALIAHAQAYVGSSMHGAITALAYRRPALAVAHTRTIKFLGLLEQISDPYRLQETWRDAERVAPNLLRPLPEDTTARLAAAEARIDMHAECLRRLVTSPAAKTAVEGRAALHAAVSTAEPEFPEWAQLRDALHARALSAPDARADDPDRQAAIIGASLRWSAGRPLRERIATARERWPQHVRLGLLEAEWFERKGDSAAAAARLRALQAAHPTNPWPMVRLVRLLIAQGEIATARDLYTEHLRDRPLPESVRSSLSDQLAL